MQRARTVLLTLLLFAVLGTEYSTAGNRGPITSSRLHYYKDSYVQCRKAFRDRSMEIVFSNRKVETGIIRVPSKIDDDLTIDWCYVPAERKQKKIFILTSGLHGIEGFAGSAVQRMFMKEVLTKIDRRILGILLIHGMNPYGFKYLRRVTENNVDLNRNFDISNDLFSLKNEGYTKINSLLNPQKKLDLKSFNNRYFSVKAIAYILIFSKKTLRQAILQGQYEMGKGIYFGGKKFEPQKGALENLLIEKLKNYDYVLHIDLHTGYGERNKLHLFPNPVRDKENLRATEKVFNGYHVDWGDSADFYTTRGDFSEYIGKLLPPSKIFIMMPFEFGTMNSQTTKGSIRSLQNMIIENQAFHHGCRSEKDCEEAKQRFMDMYYPSSTAWRAGIIEVCREILPVVVKRFVSI